MVDLLSLIDAGTQLQPHSNEAIESRMEELLRLNARAVQNEATVSIICRVYANTAHAADHARAQHVPRKSTTFTTVIGRMRCDQ
jgi:response regulator RpfG family c-di-GMP phosphodiesterase